jgi:hypothetical protein
MVAIAASSSSAPAIRSSSSSTASNSRIFGFFGMSLSAWRTTVFTMYQR